MTSYHGSGEEVEHASPLVHATFDGTHVTRAGDGLDVDEAVVSQLLDVIGSAQNEHVLLILVTEHSEFRGLPRIVNLKWGVEKSKKDPKN